MIVFWKFYGKLQWRTLRRITVSKSLKFTDNFLRIFLKNRIFLPSYSAKELCKKWAHCALWTKNIKLGKKYVITKMSGSHFLPSSMKQVVLKRKMKARFHEFLFCFMIWYTFIWRACYIFKRNLLLSGICFFLWCNPALEKSLFLMQCI